jgi:CubicO group peptidase (beta-lactamase class C family)
MRMLLILVGWGLSAAPAAAAGACAADFERQAQATIHEFVDGQAFSGALLVAVDGKPILRQAVGMANREWNIANTPDTKFRIGSVTKSFTAAAILQLAEQGKLSVDDLVSKHYANAPASWSKVTIKHLLTHTSGIPSYTSLPDFARVSRLPHTPDDLIKLIRDQPLEFEPGARFAYDNTGYLLLGKIIETASGQSYAEYLQTHIFKPLGMSDTGYDTNEAILPKRAAGYAPRQDGWANATFTDMSTPFAAGALYSTVDDLLIWEQALSAGKVLRPASTKAMFTDYGHKYGFGWLVDRKWERERISHGGGVNGFAASLQRYPEDRVTAVALSNLQIGVSTKLASDLAGLCLGASSPREVTLPASALDRYVGAYRVSEAATLQVERDGARLQTRVTGQPKVPFYAKGDHAFFARLVEAQLDFQATEKGEVTGVVLHQGGRDQTFARVDAAEAKGKDEALARRIADRTPQSGGEAALRRVIGQLQAGRPDYAQMSPDLAAATRPQVPAVQTMLNKLGALQTLTFRGVGPAGADIYEAVFAGGKLEWRIMLNADGDIGTLFVRPAS